MHQLRFFQAPSPRARTLLVFASLIVAVLLAATWLFVIGLADGVASDASRQVSTAKTTLTLQRVDDSQLVSLRNNQPPTQGGFGGGRGGGGFGGGRGGFGGGRGGGFGGPRTPDRSEYPTWEKDAQFSHDVFTFVRVRYSSNGYARRGRHWDNDYPDCDWNFSYRLQQLTSLQVDPNGLVLDLTDPELFNYPFIYMSNVGRISLSADEQAALRRYLLNGGFLMADDFWAPAAWRHVQEVMKEVFPNLQPRELTLQHELFHIVYDLKELPQVPSIHAWSQGYNFEYWHGDPMGDEGPHFQGYFDENGRLMALMCHNNDVGDGWEREGENVEFFHKFSEKYSYPLGVNIIVYAMTH